ncbi:MAG TPA: histone deacetylase [Thermomicrobiales bacterium]|nr:histone deacetylase [Thermomicrobiales bacterium]
MWSEAYLDHETGSHPESPERWVAIERALRAAGLFEVLPVLTPKAAPVERVLAVHGEGLVERVRAAAERGGAWLDPDTLVSPLSYETALLAAGGACLAARRLLGGRVPRAFALVRPPGHPAEPNRAMGFCLFNNIAVAARHAQAVHGIERVAIVDWDVHHGNGAQAIFWEDPNVLFVSLHQYPFYPGSGSRQEEGDGPGRGTTINIPLPAGTGEDVYLAAFDGVVVPALRAFAPDLILVSAGFDAHADDPLAQMRLRTESFALMAERLRDAAAELCGGRLVLVLEGGYNLKALGDSVVATIEALDRRASPDS